MERLTFPATPRGIDGRFGGMLDYLVMDHGRSSEDERPWELTQSKLLTPIVKKALFYLAMTSFLLGLAWSRLQ